MTSRDAGEAGVGQRDSARARILETAYDLFSHNGIGAVGIDRIIAEAGIAKATLYRHFPSKEELVLAFLELREQRWTHEWLEAESGRMAHSPKERLLSVFDALDEWFHRTDFEGCSFIKTLLEVDEPDSPVHRAAARHLGEVRHKLQLYAAEAGAREPEEMGYQLQVLMMGAIVSAGRGDLEAASRARVFVERLLGSST
ncbi:MAG TPA: TetR/AcrR family transcriptional regulator [Solirubrobacteraceae bacterium]|jgi:AcrR family transcriptional regulator|nr:TetR/AcrR family transcriptional regulator [Solirubrobacteraceae bacterium]